MNLYLVRHAVAYDHSDPAFLNDADRTLTPEGRKKFRRAAFGLLELIEPPAAILTSPLPRAMQTAEILREAAGRETPIAVCEGMRPRGSFDDVLRECHARARAGGTDADRNPVLKHGIALVGHAPSIGLLGAWLLNGDAARFSLTLRKGGVASIAFDDLPVAGGGELEWLLTPRILRALAG